MSYHDDPDDDYEDQISNFEVAINRHNELHALLAQYDESDAGPSEEIFICSHCSRDMNANFNERCSNGGICIPVKREKNR